MAPNTPVALILVLLQLLLSSLNAAVVQKQVTMPAKQSNKLTFTRPLCEGVQHRMHTADASQRISSFPADLIVKCSSGGYIVESLFHLSQSSLNLSLELQMQTTEDKPQKISLHFSGMV